METANFLTWFFLVLAIAGLGIGIMVYAYQGKGSVSILFQMPVALPDILPDSAAGTEAAATFQQGCSAFQVNNYSQAVEHFTQAIQQLETLAEAYHNRGLTHANLLKDNQSVIDLVRASELYEQQENRENLILLKQHLEAIKARP
ncbi:MAG: hypothetical protein HC835_14400 [Oscillatoriales cyanobacterium RM2_1_1]|nr:hypothetical protein [Oscillatoriales cyanobacterium SM2_3_0]NJO46711.1 hypothetical protein [Oscillatoriales cyanobacterium RM2_1_1]